jgi:hypothetical protein
LEILSENVKPAAERMTNVLRTWERKGHLNQGAKWSYKWKAGFIQLLK